jgi:hypothetical protein
MYLPRGKKKFQKTKTNTKFSIYKNRIFQVGSSHHVWKFQTDYENVPKKSHGILLIGNAYILGFKFPEMRNQNFKICILKFVLICIAKIPPPRMLELLVSHEYCRDTSAFFGDIRILNRGSLYIPQESRSSKTAVFIKATVPTSVISS